MDATALRLSESDLVQQCLEGDRAALGSLYEVYFPRVFRYVLARVGNVADAEDVTSEVFFRAFKALPKYRLTTSPLSSWLFRIASNEVNRHLKRRRDSALPLSSSDSLLLRGESPDTSDCVPGLLSLAAAFRALPKAQREVAALRLGAGFSLAETAEALSKPVGTVKALQHQALVTLRRLLREDAGPDAHDKVPLGNQRLAGTLPESG